MLVRLMQHASQHLLVFVAAFFLLNKIFVRSSVGEYLESSLVEDESVRRFCAVVCCYSERQHRICGKVAIKGDHGTSFPNCLVNWIGEGGKDSTGQEILQEEFKFNSC